MSLTNAKGRLYEFSQEELKMLKESFDMLDTKHKGYIDREGFISILRNFGLKMTIEQIDAMIKEVDLDDNGQIEFDEFLVMMAKNHKDPEEFSEEMEAAFSMIDTNSDGTISRQEVKAFFEMVAGKVADEKAIDDIMRKCDENHDGKIDKREFRKMLLELQPSGN